MPFQHCLNHSDGRWTDGLGPSKTVKVHPSRPLRRLDGNTAVIPGCCRVVHFKNPTCQQHLPFELGGSVVSRSFPDCSVTARTRARMQMPGRMTAGPHCIWPPSTHILRLLGFYLNTAPTSIPGTMTERFRFVEQRILASHDRHDLINMMHLLLEHGTDVNTRDNEGSTPLHYTSFSTQEGR